MTANAPNANRIKGVPVADLTLTDGYVLTYDSTTGTLRLEAASATDISGKADKVEGAVAGNIAKLDANGNLVDSNIGLPYDIEDLYSTSTVPGFVVQSGDGGVSTIPYGDYTSSARTLTGTAPVKVDGDNAAHDLTANRTISVADASASVAGVVTTTAQSFAGVKTFSDGLISSKRITSGVTAASVAGGGTYTVDPSLGDTFQLTANGNFTLAFNTTNAVNGHRILIEVYNATGGDVTITLSGSYRFGNNVTALDAVATTKTALLGVEYSTLNSANKYNVLAWDKGF